MKLDLSSSIAEVVNVLEATTEQILRSQERTLRRQQADKKKENEHRRLCEKLYRNRLLHANKGAHKLLKALEGPKIRNLLSLLRATGAGDLFLYGTSDTQTDDVSIRAGGGGRLFIKVYLSSYEEDFGNLQETVRSKGGGEYSSPYPILQELETFLGKHHTGSYEEAVQAIDSVDLSKEIPFEQQAMGVLKFLMACNSEKFLVTALTSAIEKAVPKKSRKRDRKQ